MKGPILIFLLFLISLKVGGSSCHDDDDRHRRGLLDAVFGKFEEVDVVMLLHEQLTWHWANQI